MSSTKLRIIHFNDVYNAWPRDKGDIVGGGARFKKLVDSYRTGGSNHNGVEPLVFFSGDVFFPSLASQVTLGKQMVPIMNGCGISCACLGNHDTDHGVDIFARRAKATNFPWLLSNVKLKTTGKIFTAEAGTKESHIVTSPCGSLKIGLIGLAEEQWVQTLSCVDANDILYEDFVACTKRLAPALRAEGADVVIALTHMRIPRDQRLAKEAGDELLIVLGGHDHDPYYETLPNGISIVKSGTDFLEMTVVDLEVAKDVDKSKKASLSSYKHKHVDVTKDMPEDEELVKELQPFTKDLAKNMKKVIGHNGVDLDCRFATIRTKESNVSNFVADCIRWNIHPKPDIVLINSGTLRADQVVPAGPYTVADLLTLLPMLDFLVVLNITGTQLLQALENGVSQYPALEGRFPIVSGIRWKFDPRNPPGKRVIENSVVVGSEALDLNRTYTLVTKEYLSEGKDGYDCFKECEIAVESELLPALATCVSRYYLIQKAASAFASAGERHAKTSENVKIAACRWFEKALKRSPSCTPRSSHSSPPVSATFEKAATTPRGPKKEEAHQRHQQQNESDKFENTNASVSSDSSSMTPRALSDGESPTLHWAVKTFMMRPNVERRIWNVAEQDKK